MDKSKKKISITLVMCIIALLLIIGGSYALWNKTIETENSGLEVYSTELNLLESDSEIINIENAFPMIDEVGMKQEDTFDFEVKTKTKKDINIRYDLVIEKIGIKCSEIENPTIGEHPGCYDLSITEEDRAILIDYIMDYLEYNKDDATEYYDLLYTKDDKGLKDFYIRIYDITEEIAEENVAKDKEYGYIKWVIFYYENEYGLGPLSAKDESYKIIPLSGNEINEIYTFNGEYKIYPDSLKDEEIKIYLTDYEDNVLAGPIKVSELDDDYVIYTIENTHENQEEIKNKYKLRMWIDESVKPEEWDENKQLSYGFKIAVKTTPNYNVNVTVKNGIVLEEPTKYVLRNNDAEFNIVKNIDENVIGQVKCTNGQEGYYEDNYLVVENVTKDTTCEVNLVTHSTTLYEDGTLIMNETAEDRIYNIETFGQIKKEYEGLSETQSYNFNFNEETEIADTLWYKERKLIKNIIIGNEIYPTSTAYWFYNCENLETSYLNNLNTSETTNMRGMFRDSGRNATTWKIEGLANFDTSKVTDMNSLFYYAGPFVDTWKIGDLSSWDVSNVADMSSMFAMTGVYATEFDIGDLSSWDVSKVTDMSSLFYRTGSYADTWDIGDLSSWDVSNVADMSYMFYDAGEDATEFDIGDLSSWDVSNVADMSSMFHSSGYNATTWSVGDLSNWKTQNVTTMYRMFYKTGYSTSTFDIGDISKWDTSSVTDMSQMFYKAGYSATYILDLSGWNVQNVTSHGSFNYGVTSKITPPVWVN